MPLVQAGKRGFKAQAATEIAGLVGQRHIIATPREGEGGFEAGGASAHHQHLPLAIAAHNLGVPAAPPFLACRGVLGAADPDAIMPA